MSSAAVNSPRSIHLLIPWRLAPPPGYGDIVMSPTWRLPDPLETANGMLLFGVSTAMIFAVIQRLLEARFAEFRE